MEKTKFEVYIEEKTQNYGKIFLEPLERGYGDTLGNALRRLLLSSIRGAAVTAVRIDGVLHEFSTIKGIREDVIEILMNLKQIPIKAKHDRADEGFKIITIDSDFLPKNFFTRKENPGVITAADLPKDNDFEFCGDNVLCTLEPDAHLLMEIYVEQGVGYLSSERERPAEPSLPIDALLTDAIFSPVKRVNYQIEPARVGKSIDYERLVLEVWTNGAITPEEAIKQASEIAEKCFNQVAETVLTAKIKDPENFEPPIHIDPFDKGKPGGSTHGKDKTFEEEPAPPAPSTRPISEIGLTVRAANCLLRGGIATLQDLLDRSHEDLLKLRNLGKKSLKEIEDKVEDLGYVLATSPEPEETEAQPEEVKQEVKEAEGFSSKKDPKTLLADIFIDSDNAVQEAEDLIKAKNKEEEEKPAEESTKKKTAKSTRAKKSEKSDVKAEEVKEVKEETEKVEVKEEPKEPEADTKTTKKKTSRSKKSEKTEPKVEEVKEEVKEPETEAKTEKKKSSRSKKSEKSEVKAEEVKEVKEVKETKKEKAAKTAKGKAKKEVQEVKEEVKEPEPEPEAKVEAEPEAKPEKKKTSRAKKTEKSEVKAEEVKEVKKVKEAKTKKEKAEVKEEKSEKPAKTKATATKTKKAAESDSDKKKSASKSKTAKTKKEKDRKEGA